MVVKKIVFGAKTRKNSENRSKNIKTCESQKERDGGSNMPMLGGIIE